MVFRYSENFGSWCATIPKPVVQYLYHSDLANHYSSFVVDSKQKEVSALFKCFKEQMMKSLELPAEYNSSHKLRKAICCMEGFKIDKTEKIYEDLFYQRYQPSYYLAAESAALRGDFVKGFLIAYQGYGIGWKEERDVRGLCLRLGEKLDLEQDLMLSLFSEMIERCEKAPSIYGGLSIIWFLKGDYCFRQGDFVEARAAYSESLRIASDRWLKWMCTFKMTLTYVDHNDRLAALEQSREKKEFLVSEDIKFFIFKAEIEELIGEHIEAFKTLKGCFADISPSNYWKLELALLYQSLRCGSSDFKENLTRVIQIYPRKGLFWQMQIQYAYLHEQDMVKEYLKQALRYAENSPEVLCEYARYQFCIEKNTKLAECYLNRAVACDSTHHYKYGDIYIELARILLEEEGENADFSEIIRQVAVCRPKRGILWGLASKGPYVTPREVLLNGVEHLRKFPSLFSINSFLYSALYDSLQINANSLNPKEIVSSLGRQKAFIRSPLN